jgi:hypothetical protein
MEVLHAPNVRVAFIGRGCLTISKQMLTAQGMPIVSVAHFLIHTNQPSIRSMSSSLDVLPELR